MKISIEEVNKLKRFDVEVNTPEDQYPNFVLIERPNGDYVKFSDIHALFVDDMLTIDAIDDNPVHIAQDIIDGLVEDRKHNKLSTRLTNSITEAAKMVDDINRRGGSFHDWLINPCQE